MDEGEEVFDFLSWIIIKEAKIEEGKGSAIASQFSRLESFIETDFLTKKFMRMDKTEIILNQAQRERLEGLKKFVNKSGTVRANWMWYLSQNFINTTMRNIKELSLDTMNVNPFLIRALNLESPDEVVRFNVYQTATRSIVTSMGFTLENLVARSGARKGKKGEWYDVVKEIGDLTYWIQVKSGPNDVDADQVRHFSPKFDETESVKNNLARLGITYGKRSLTTISFSHLKKYMNNWEERLLVGKELWDFVSSEKNYHVFVLDSINEIATKLLKGSSVEKEIENAVKNITIEFESKFGKGKDGVNKFIKEII